ncbi:MAG: patatin-like phospholipase family protein [Terriglobia bacterium]|jgi:NTE family protein
MNTQTPNAQHYLPFDEPQRNGMGLSLSGGGFRATLFHLGAIRRLSELGILKQFRTISSVSGGSILNGFLASRLASPLAKGISDFEREVSAPMRAFCSLDIRRWPALERLIPGLSNSEQLAHQYEEHLTQGKLLCQIPGEPVHIFCSTDLAYGVNWMFKQKQCGDYQAGFEDTPPGWKVSSAIAASSCFPPVFKPMAFHLDPAQLRGGKAAPGAVRDAVIRGMTFSDGGVYDNLGLEPIWKDHEFALASDGGALFPSGGDTGFAWEVGRFISIPEDQALALRKRWLISSFIAKAMKGTYWGIGGTVTEYDRQLPPGYSADLVKNFIAPIRTDLDSFSEAEAAVLENHGYWLADAALRTHLPELLPTPLPAFALPHPDWDNRDENKIKRALKDSSHRTVLGRS